MDITATRLKRIGKYMLGKVLGQGASGMVRMGRNTSTGKTSVLTLVREFGDQWTCVWSGLTVVVALCF